MTDTKNKILYTALDLFSEKGYDAVSVSMIANAVGVTKGALYRHYKSKREIFDRILAEMSDMDYERAKSCDMPSRSYEEAPEEYKNVTEEQIKRYTLEQFDYWTKDAFASRFCKMISIERFKSAEIAELYKNYLTLGPVGYLSDIFAGALDLPLGGEQAYAAALEFYAPFFLLVYAGGRLNQTESQAALSGHIDRFFARVFGSQKIKN